MAIPINSGDRPQQQRPLGKGDINPRCQLHASRVLCRPYWQRFFRLLSPHFNDQ